MKKLFRNKKFIKYIVLLFASLYLLSAFNYEIINLSHSISHYISHPDRIGIELNHEHNLLDHLDEAKKSSHDHSEILLALVKAEQEKEKQAKNIPLENERKNIDQHIISGLSQPKDPDNSNILYHNFSIRILPLFSLKPSTPPPQIFSC